jgi:hypothetical protein
MSEINRRVDQYEQIHGSPDGASPGAEVQPSNLAAVNLASCDWQELHLEAIALKEENPMLHRYETVWEQQDSLLAGIGEPTPWDMVSIPHVLLSLPGQDCSVRLAYGQDILFQDGRVFFRILQNAK